MKSHSDYVEKLACIEPNIEVIGEYAGSISCIEVRCKICGNIWSPVASRLINKQRPSKCPKCHCKPVGHNDQRYFAVAMPYFAQFLVNIEDGYRYRTQSSKKVDWICPDCGSLVKGIPINKVFNRHRIPCKVCSDGISYPNKLMYQMLLQLDEEFVTEYSPKWISPKRFDFFIPRNNVIIEMDGAIGHGGKTYTGTCGDKLLEVDKYKDRMAKINGMRVIRIDCKTSELGYIVERIKSSDLSELYNLECVDWDVCDRKALTSLQMFVCNLWNESHDMSYVLKKSKLSRYTTTRYLNKLSRLGLCKYDPKAQHSASGKANIKYAYEKNKKAVICLNTHEVFESCKAAYIWLGYNICGHSIQDNCKGITQSAGKDPATKEKLKWMFYSDYLAEVV